MRLHSECLTGDVLGSQRCDCGPQLREGVERIAASGGYLLYLRQEGRGIGLYAKLEAYELQDAGADTELARVCNHHLGERYAGSARLLEAQWRLEEELATIRKLGLSGFLLLHRDLLELAREVELDLGLDRFAESLDPDAVGRRAARAADALERARSELG